MLKKCRCGTEYIQYTSLQTRCPRCLAKRAQEVREKKERKAHREAKDRIKSRSDWLREAQAAFNKYIRLRDKDEPCISCGRHHQGQYHAGHYRSVGAAPELRFNLFNVHKQCAPCNNHKSGNAIEYRINLVNKIGLDEVSRLEGPHQAKKYTLDEIKEIKQGFNQWARELEDLC